MREDTNQNQNNQSPQSESGEGNFSAPETPRVNPEMDAVEANSPPQYFKPTQTAEPAKSKEKKSESAVVSKTSVAPKKIGAESKKPSKSKFLLGCAGGFLILFIIFILLMVLMISRAGIDNPVMRAFGLDSVGMRQFLLTIINLAFGVFSILFFVLMIIGIFRWLSAKKTDKDTKKKVTKMTIFSTASLIFMLFIWFSLSAFIIRLPIATELVIAEIVITEPESLEDLQAPVEITFSAENVAIALIRGGLSIQGMDWDLDGNSEFETPVGADPTVTRLYNRRGTYEVGLRVSIAGEDQPRIYTIVIPIEEAVFRADPDSGFAPLSVQFDASGLIPSGFKVASLDWDFDGDGKYDIEGPDNLRPRYTFEQIGIYNVHLRIVDQQNNVENYNRDIEVIPSDTPLLQASIDSVPGLSGPIPFQIRFDGSQSKSVKGTIINYEWDFGDGTNLQSGKSVSHIFNNPGFYKVTLTVKEDSGKTASSYVEVEAKSVSSVPEAVINTDPSYDKSNNTLTGVLPFMVDFDASDSLDADNDIVDYQWDFDNDGEIDQEGKKSNFTFENAGTYIVKLNVSDSENQSNTATITVVVQEPGVKAVITAVPEDGTAPLVVQFDGSASSTFEGNIVSYEWGFGDDSPKTITGATISHKYNEVGNYTVTLKVVTNKGESAETSKIIYVREIPLKACFTPSRYKGSAPLTVTFDSMCSTGAVSEFSWDFGDGEASDSRKPTHTFEFPGTYTVILEVADDKSNVSIYNEVIVAEGEIE